MPVAALLALIQALVSLEPVAAAALPIAEKALSGGAVTAADIATLDATVTALNTKLAAQVAAFEAAGTVTGAAA